MKYSIGIDLGGTNIAMGIVNENAVLVAKRYDKTGNICEPELLARHMKKAADMLLEDANFSWEMIAHIGLGVPGTVNFKTGEIEFANNLKFINVPFRNIVEKVFEKKVFLENDANAAAYGEFLHYDKPAQGSFVMLTLGTGIGGSVIENGQFLRGVNGSAGELGHITVDINGAPCNCGSFGCFENYASATALMQQTKVAMEADKISLLWNICGENEQKVTGETAFQAMKQGDKTATRVVQAYLKYLCVGINSIINIFQPDVLCIGGGISNEGETILVSVRQFLAQYGYARYSTKQTYVMQAKLGNDAGIIGAALFQNTSQ